MTYCVGLLLNEGMVLLSDTRTNAGLDNISTYRKMFTFEDLLKLDSKSVQMVLKEVSGDMLVIALKGASTELKELILGNMSSRAAEGLRDDLESRGPVRLSEVEGQQKGILEVGRRRSDEGTIVVGGGGDDGFV